MSDSPARVLVVDDHPVIRHGLDRLLEEELGIGIVDEADSSDAALQLIDQHDFDLVILDIGLKSGSGLDLIGHIRARTETLPILVYSMHQETYYAERVLRAGAQGYLEKQSPSETVLPAIRRVLSGELYLSPAMSDELVRRAVDGGDGRRTVEELSDRETEVVRFIGQGLSTREIAEELSLSIKTIESYRANVKRKLGLRSGAELARFAYDWTNKALGILDSDAKAPDGEGTGEAAAPVDGRSNGHH